MVRGTPASGVQNRASILRPSWQHFWQGRVGNCRTGPETLHLKSASQSHSRDAAGGPREAKPFLRIKRSQVRILPGAPKFEPRNPLPERVSGFAGPLALSHAGDTPTRVTTRVIASLWRRSWDAHVGRPHRPTGSGFASRSKKACTHRDNG